MGQAIGINVAGVHRMELSRLIVGVGLWRYLLFACRRLIVWLLLAAFTVSAVAQIV